MAEIRYIPTEIHALRGAHLREYEYSMENGYEVNSNEQIGPKMQNGSQINVIFPVTYSTDKKWIQVINDKGLTGFIRASHVKVKNLKEEDAKPFDMPYTYFMSDEDRIVYEAEHGIREYGDDAVEVAKERREKLLQGEELFKVFKLAKGINSDEDLLPMHVTDVFDYWRDIYGNEKKEEKELLANYFEYRHKKARENIEINRLKEAGIPILYDEKTGRIQTAASLTDLLGYDNGSTIRSENNKKYEFPENYNGFIRDDEDVKTFVVGNRAYAERTAAERAKYRQDEEKKQKAKTSVRIPQTLKDDYEQRKEELSVSKEDLTDVFYKQKVSHGGFLIAEEHRNRKTRDWIGENIASMKNAGIHTIYVEHIFSGLDQKLIDDYLKSSNDELSPALKGRCNKSVTAGLDIMLMNAKKHGMRVVGLASHLCQADTAKDPCARALLFNQHAAEQIKLDQESKEKSERGYVVLVGAAHAAMHFGRKGEQPIEGLSQLLEMHTFELDEENRLTIKEPDLVVMPEDTFMRFNQVWKAAKPTKDLEFEEITPEDLQAANERHTNPRNRRLMDVKALESEEKQANNIANKKASVRIGAYREKAAQKSAPDLGFTEITKDDIKEANKNVKKPELGAHRKNKK